MPDDHLPLPDDLHYLPADWLDECVPPPLDLPDGFIFRDGDRWILRPADDDDVEPHLVRELRAGDIVQFCEHRHFGSFTLDVRADAADGRLDDLEARLAALENDMADIERSGGKVVKLRGHGAV